jgi:predicted metal-binding protein
VRIKFPHVKAAKLIQYILFVARSCRDAKPGRQPIDTRGKEIHDRLTLRSYEGFVEGIDEQVVPSP